MAVVNPKAAICGDLRGTGGALEIACLTRNAAERKGKLLILGASRAATSAVTNKTSTGKQMWVFRTKRVFVKNVLPKEENKT